MEHARQAVISEISADSERLASLLASVAIGAVISYDTLSAGIGRDVQTEARGNLMTARNKVMREEQAVFEPIRDVGLKRLTDGELAHIGDATLLKINRTTKRGVRKLTCVTDFTVLTEAQKIKHNAAMSLLGVFYQVSKAKSIRQIEQMVEITQRSLPVGDTLKAFLR